MQRESAELSNVAPSSLQSMKSAAAKSAALFEMIAVSSPDRYDDEEDRVGDG